MRPTPASPPARLVFLGRERRADQPDADPRPEPARRAGSRLGPRAAGGSGSPSWARSGSRASWRRWASRRRPTGRCSTPTWSRCCCPSCAGSSPTRCWSWTTSAPTRPAGARAARRLGFAYRYLPRYSPDLNPIEPAWAKVKAACARRRPATVDGLHAALGPALDTITAQDARLLPPRRLRLSQPH